MARQQYDPLSILPSPDVIRAELEKTLTLAERLRILLDVAERLRLSTSSVDCPSPPARKEVAHV